MPSKPSIIWKVVVKRGLTAGLPSQSSGENSVLPL